MADCITPQEGRHETKGAIVLDLWRWSKVGIREGDKDIARRTIRFFENRRLLFGSRGRDLNDPLYCVRSAQAIRDFLGTQLAEGSPGPKLRRALQEMQAACRRFVSQAGDHADAFRGDSGRFFVAVGELRTTFGFYLGALADRYNLEVHDDLAGILPPVVDYRDA